MNSNIKIFLQILEVLGYSQMSIFIVLNICSDINAL